MGAALPPLVAVFFAGRLVRPLDVGGWLHGAPAQPPPEASWKIPVSDPGIALQVALLGGVVVLARVNWRRILLRPAPKRPSPPAP